MDIFVFLALITLQITLLSIIAIIFGQTIETDKIFTGLTNILKTPFSKLKKRRAKPAVTAATNPSASQQINPVVDNLPE